MIILLYAAIGLAALAIVGNLMLAQWNARRVDEKIGARADAYLASLERQGLPEPLAALDPAERREVLAAAGRDARAQSNTRFYIWTLGGIAGFFVALGFAIEGAGMRDFVLVLLATAAVLYGITTFLHRSFRARMAAQGIDVERLKTD